MAGPSLPPGARVVSGLGLTLRPFVDEDLPRLVEAFADDAVAAWNPGPQTSDELLAWVRRRNDWTSGEHVSWAVVDDTGALAGSVSLHRIDWDQADAEIGYWIGPWARRRRVASRAVCVAADYAFGVLDLHRIYLFHAVDNLASCRVAGLAGFRQEGALKQSFRYSDGNYHDEHLHALLAGELRGRADARTTG